MKVLFVFDKPLQVESGGVERVTSTVMNGLSNHYDFVCKYAYDDGQTVFIDDREIVDVESFLLCEKIDVIVQQIAYSSSISKEILKKNLKIPFVVAWHTAPPTLKKTWYVATTKVRGGFTKQLKRLARILAFPLFFYKEQVRFRKRWESLLPITTKILLLSPSFIPDFENILKLPSNRFYAIPNPISFPKIFDASILDKKEKRVLIVARMREMQKRISLALKVWKIIESNDECLDWHLDIVGDGEDLPMYKDMANRYSLKRVHFYGSQNPVPFYERSSIFLMTSCFEGWGLTIMESAQYGIPTIAFDSYASLKDIINENENGLRIPFADTRSYAHKLRSLMLNDEQRKNFALNSIRLVDRFTLQNVLPIWKDFLLNVQVSCK